MWRSWTGSWQETLHGPKAPDLLAAFTVAAVAMPLNLALAVASGLPPAAGLFAGAIGGAIAAVFGGTPLQVTGPAAALSLMVLGLAQRFGPTGVAAACLVIGLVQVTLAFSGLGRLGAHVPESVLAGFTTGVGLTLLDKQIPELLGFGIHQYKTTDLAGMMHKPLWLHHVSWLAVVSGLLVAFTIVGLSRFKRVPAAALAVTAVTFLATYVGWDVERIRDIGEVPAQLPSLVLPVLPDEQWLDLLLAALPLALLAGVESLLSSHAVDRMKGGGKRHDPDLELLGQGLANGVVGLFSGMPVSGVVVRSGVNVQSGGRTRLSALLHGVLMAVLALGLADTIGLVPQAALAGLLCVIGFRLIEVKPLLHLLQTDRLEAAAFLAAALGTASGHLMTGLVAGGVLHAASRWLRRDDAPTEAKAELPEGVRAVLGSDRAHARSQSHARRHPAHAPPTHHATHGLETHRWMGHIRGEALVAPTAYVHPNATVIGRVVLGEHVHVAADTSVRADEGTPFFIGANSNVQDGVVMHALKDKWVDVAGESWAIYVGRDVSMAHGAIVHGPCYIGDHTFVGFKAVVHDAIVGSGCYVGIGAVVVGVEVPDGRFVPHGAIVDSADAVDRLPLVSEKHRAFNEDVVEVNRGLALAYSAVESRVTTQEREDAVREQALEARPWEPRWSTPLHKERF